MAFLTDRTLTSGVTRDNLVHIVITGDTSQNPAGSSYKATLGQIIDLYTGSTDVFVTGGTYSNGTLILTNNTGGTINISGFYTGGTDVFVTGGTYDNNTGTATFTNNTGGTFNVTGFYTGGTKTLGSFYDSGDQTGLAGTVLTLSANTSDSWNNGVSLSADTRFIIQSPGVYNLAFSAQMVKTGGNSSTHAHIWLSQNGSDVAYSASQIGFPSNSVYVVAAWNFFFETTVVNEYVELKWEINSNVDNQLFVKYQPASGNVPEIPSLIVTINKVS